VARSQPDERREEIVAAARTLFAERGVSRTSISDVATRVGVTRGLVYHYVGDKDSLVDIVLEEHIGEFVRSIRAWDAAREVGSIELALADCIALFRRYVAGQDSLADQASAGSDLPRIENAGLYNRFLDRAVRAMVDTLRATTVEAYGRRHRIAIENVDETFCLLLYGLIGLTRANPDVDDAVLAALVRQTLRLDPDDQPDDRPDDRAAISTDPAPADAEQHTTQ
jgi:AcrR family transcriptional regulator